MTESDETASQRRKGRPIGKRGTFTFRVTPALRVKLEDAARASERPVSEEVERRLERSFEDVDLLLAYFGSTQTLRLAQSISLLARTVEMKTGKSWISDALTKRDFSSAITRFFQIVFYEQNEENSISSAPFTGLGDLDSGRAAAETVAKTMGLKSKAWDAMEAFLATPEGREALERLQNRDGHD